MIPIYVVRFPSLFDVSDFYFIFLLEKQKKAENRDEDKAPLIPGK